MMCVRKAIRLYSMRFYFDVVVMIDIYIVSWLSIWGVYWDIFDGGSGVSCKFF